MKARAREAVRLAGGIVRIAQVVCLVLFAGCSTTPSRPSKMRAQYDRDAVTHIVTEHVNEIRGCYERALLANPKLGSGKVALEWTIGKDGSVTKVGSKASTFKSTEVVNCLLELFHGFKFPEPQGGVVVVGYPLFFNAVDY